MAGRSLASPRRMSDSGCGMRWPAGRYVPHGRSGGNASGPAPPNRAQRSRRPSHDPGSRKAGICQDPLCPGRSRDGIARPSFSCFHSLDGPAVCVEEASGAEIQRVLILGKDHAGKVVLDLPVIVGGIGAVGHYDWHSFPRLEHGLAFKLPTREVLGVTGGLATVVDFESHDFPPVYVFFHGRGKLGTKANLFSNGGTLLPVSSGLLCCGCGGRAGHSYNLSYRYYYLLSYKDL